MSTLTKWSPFREMEGFVNQFQRSLDPWRRGGEPAAGEGFAASDWYPTVDVVEGDHEYLIKVEVPEVEKEDLKVTIQDGVLTIEGERRMELENKQDKYYRLERGYGSFLRRFNLPPEVDENRIRARHKDGMLYLHLEKSSRVDPKAVQLEID